MHLYFSFFFSKTKIKMVLIFLFSLRFILTTLEHILWTGRRSARLLTLISSIYTVQLLITHLMVEMFIRLLSCFSRNLYFFGIPKRVYTCSSLKHLPSHSIAGQQSWVKIKCKKACPSLRAGVENLVAIL